MDSAHKLEEKKSRRAPAMSPEAREKQLTALAYDAVEKRIKNGKASSQELIHFLKMGSSREKLEKENLEYRKQLMEAKTESLQATARSEELFEEAIKAFTIYSGADTRSDDDYE